MADFKVASPSRGLEWFRGGVRMLDRNPRGLLLVALGLAIIAQLPSLLGQLSQPGLALAVVIALLRPALDAGLLCAVDDADGGRPIGLMHLFEGLRRPGVRSHLIQLGVLFLILGALAGLSAWHLMGKENIDTFVRLVQKKIAPDSAQAQAMALPFMKAFLAVAFIMLLAMAGMFFAVPRVLFQDRPALPAFVESIAACAANLLPLLVYGLVFAAAGVAVMIGVAIAGAFLGLLGSVGVLLLWLIVMALFVVFLVVASSANYLAWREIFGAPVRVPLEPPQMQMVV